jgi:alpha-tubulin suppressor-like RCC1 family protein
LGRNTSKNKKKVTHPGPVQSFNDHNLKATKVFVSNSVQKDSGHSAIVDENGRLWMSGCDRWQQLGLGSVNGGSAGYTWKGGKLWQEKFMLSESVTTEIAKNINNTKTSKDPSIRDVALGEDHTLVLSSNKQDVFAFGKCGDGQCGFIGKPYVSAPRRSKVLSSGKSSIAAVCAIESCSMTIDDDGNIVQKVGKCTPSSSESASASPSSLLSPSVLSDGIEKCINDARQHGLINETEGSQN